MKENYLMAALAGVIWGKGNYQLFLSKYPLTKEQQQRAAGSAIKALMMSLDARPEFLPYVNFISNQFQLNLKELALQALATLLWHPDRFERDSVAILIEHFLLDYLPIKKGQSVFAFGEEFYDGRAENDSVIPPLVCMHVCCMEDELAELKESFEINEQTEELFKFTASLFS